jgi:hypothetical protein
VAAWFTRKNTEERIVYLHSHFFRLHPVTPFNPFFFPAKMGNASECDLPMQSQPPRTIRQPPLTWAGTISIAGTFWARWRDYVFQLKRNGYV